VATAFGKQGQCLRLSFMGCPWTWTYQSYCVQEFTLEHSSTSCKAACENSMDITTSSSWMVATNTTCVQLLSSSSEHVLTNMQCLRYDLHMTRSLHTTHVNRFIVSCLCCYRMLFCCFPLYCYPAVLPSHSLLCCYCFAAKLPLPLLPRCFCLGR
jgi:hypothetical protein